MSPLLEIVQPDPLVFLYAIDLPTDPPTKLRVTPYPETLYLGRDNTGAAVPYYPFAIGHDESTGDVEGSLPTITLKAQNLTREMVALLEAYGGLAGQKVRIVLARLSDLPDGTPQREEIYKVLSASATETTAELRLGQNELERQLMPGRRITRLHCAHVYGGPGCGYDTTRAGALQTCSKLEDGPNGCIEHGLDEAAASLPNNHPEPRMLRFRGVPREIG